MGTIPSTSPFLTWFAEWGNVVFALSQILFWAAIGTSALIAALQYRRFVSHAVGATGRPAAKAEEPALEPFVE